MGEFFEHLKIFYATQVSQSPPTFMLFANRKLARSDTYRRYLENTLRRELGLPGVPVRLGGAAAVRAEWG